MKRRLLDRWREAGPNQLDSAILIGSHLESLIRCLELAWVIGMPGMKTVMEREDLYGLGVLCILTFWWKTGEKDGYKVLSDTPCIRRRNISAPGPLASLWHQAGAGIKVCHITASEGQFSGKEMKTDLFSCFKQNNAYPSFSSTQIIPLPPLVFQWREAWSLCWRSYTGRHWDGRKGLARDHLPSSLPAPSFSKGFVPSASEACL